MRDAPPNIELVYDPPPPPAGGTSELSGAFHSKSKPKLTEHARQRVELGIALLRQRAVERLSAKLGVASKVRHGERLCLRDQSERHRTHRALTAVQLGTTTMQSMAASRR